MIWKKDQPGRDEFCSECGKTRAGHEADERATLTGWAYHPYSADRTSDDR